MEITLALMRKTGALSRPPEKQTCRCCGQTKPVKEFKKQATYATGYSNDCKACLREKEAKKKAQEANSGFFVHDKKWI